MSARNYEKAKHYASILALLEHEKLTSLSLSMDFRNSIARGCCVSLDEVSNLMEYAYQNVDFDTSCIYMDWKK
tara:strand:+ start:399 stop:617 length:219 start_codon:yes stop_codon:yes gene_type:complete